MKIYTKTGDKGTTSLVGGTRVSKCDIRLNAYGTVDELNSWLGFIISLMEGQDATSRKFLFRLQNMMFDLGCALATEADSKYRPKEITMSDVEEIETEIDRLEAVLPHHDKFILPGGTKAASAANVARTVCRRAERIMCGMDYESFAGGDCAMQFINRVSDYLFVLGRHLNNIAGEPEKFWTPDKS